MANDMWPIVYRVLYPGILVFVIFACYAFFKFRAFSRRRAKSYLRDGIIAICVSVFGLGLSVYFSGDLLFKDFITAEGTFIDYTRDNDVRELKFLVDGELKEVKILVSEYSALSPEAGEYFVFTYAIRTNMVLSIERITG